MHQLIIDNENVINLFITIISSRPDEPFSVAETRCRRQYSRKCEAQLQQQRY